MLTAEYDLATALKVSKEEGIEIGIQKSKIEIAKNLIDILDIDTIAEKTGLSVEVIRNLIENKGGIEDISTNPYQTSNFKNQ